MSNSEVGHTNIGAGRVVYQDLLRISNEVDSTFIRTSSSWRHKIWSDEIRRCILPGFYPMAAYTVIPHILKRCLRWPRGCQRCRRFTHSLMERDIAGDNLYIETVARSNGWDRYRKISRHFRTLPRNGRDNR